MTVYAEYLFLENYIAGLLLLWLTGRMTGQTAGQMTGRMTGRPAAAGQKPLRLRRLLAGAAISGISGFLIFVPMNGAVGFLVRCLLAAIITAAALGADNPEQLMRKTAVFLILSFLSGGMTMAVFLWQQVPALSGNGIIYVEPVTYGGLVLCSIPALGLTWWFVNWIRRRNREEKTRGTVQIRMEGHQWEFSAMVDTGNCLREPLTGKPVILADRKGKRKMEERGLHPETLQHRTAAIPYTAVGVKKGLLEGIRLDEVCFAGKRIQGAVLAFYEGDFRGFEILLHQEMLEGGILEDD